MSVCRGDGSGYASVEACGSNQVCRSGACEPIVCVPDAYTCEGNKIFSCNGTGTTRTEIADCGTKYCVPGEDTCRDQFCTPGEVRCDGALSATCNSDGTAYASTVDCRSTQQVCLGGSCTAPICEPNEVFCNSAGNVALCNIDGSGYRTRSTCLPPRNHCVDGYVDCIPRICEAGQAVCFGQLATQCNAAGDGYEPGGVDCSTQGLACSDGACVLPLCVPNEIICYLGDPHRCNPTGTDLTKQTTCAYNQFCDSVTNSCKSDLCQANSPGCLGTQLATCAADGSGYVSDGHDCASSPGMTCSGGQCVPVICTSPQQCKNDHVYECVDSGGALKLKQSCSSGTHCRDSDVTCVANVCPAGQPSCDGQRATTCNQDGSGFLSGGTSCPEKCAGGACVSSLFSDDFEDGDASDWSADAVILSVAGNAANGTSYALTAESQSLNGSATRTFAAARPRSISWWQYLDSNTGGSVEFASAYTTDPPIRLETYGNRITLASYPSNTTLAAEAWHHFEIRYVDWVKRLADVYIDGQLKYIGLGVSLSAVDRVTLRVASARRLVVDEIQFD
ncbi:MAG: hypothetical protein KC766_28015 [Myxococcales bacterium]|nr:hypothetical protein [Myxococcales bacterium]